MKRVPSFERRLPIGAELAADSGAHFRLWAPDCQKVELVLEDERGAELQSIAMQRDSGGYHTAASVQAAAGALYRFRLDGREQRFADPASRFQPTGPEGPSQVVDPDSFSWTDDAWNGTELKGQVLYELHLGTFTPEGTWRAAAEQLAELAAAGFTLLEIMPLADWVGDFNWGYDGVSYFAPTRLYGTPDDMRAFVDRAHSLGIGVLLDVVYNHPGARGNHFKEFAASYMSRGHITEWGPAFNFDEDQAEPVRQFFVANICYWIDEFHIDGFRMDATQAYFDSSPKHILEELTTAARKAAGARQIILIAESEPQEICMIHPVDRGGFAMDAVWNDDFHHTAMVRLTGHNEAYYTDYLGTPEEFIASFKYGYLFQGQHYKWQGKRRGSAAIGTPGEKFVNYIQNHDQIANSARGLRINELTSPGRLRAMTALLLLAPGTPLVFQGQEFAASTPFLYFNDSGPMADDVAKGRASFLKQFPSLALAEVQRRLPRPDDPDNFRASKLNFAERAEHGDAYRLHRDLLALRKSDPVISAQRSDRLDGARLADNAFVIRYFGEGDDRLLLVNFGVDLHLSPAPQPLLAPRAGCRWQMLWTSECVDYGGVGTPQVESASGWHLPAEAAVVMKSIPYAGNPYAFDDDS